MSFPIILGEINLKVGTKVRTECFNIKLPLIKIKPLVVQYKRVTVSAIDCRFYSHSMKYFIFSFFTTQHAMCF